MGIFCANCTGLVNIEHFYSAVFVVKNKEAIESLAVQSICAACYLYIPLDRQTRTGKIDNVTDVFTFCRAIHIPKLIGGRLVDDWNFDTPIFVASIETVVEYKLHRLIEKILPHSRKAVELYERVMLHEEERARSTIIRRA